MKKLLPIVMGIVFGLLLAGCSVVNELVSGSATVEIALETSSLVSTKGITVAKYAVTNAKVVFSGVGIAYTNEWTIGSPTSFLYTVQPGDYWITVTEIDENEDAFTTYSNSINVRRSQNYRVKISLGGHVMSTVDTNASTVDTNLPAGMVAYYPFNGDASDQSGNGYDGTVNGAQLTVDRNGESNNAYYFDGTNSYINLVPADTLGICSNDFTISVWIKADSFRSDNGILGACGEGTVGTEEVLHLKVVRNSQWNDQLVFAFYNDVLALSQQTLNVSQWYHLVVTYSLQNQVKSIYINGTLDAIVSNSGMLNVNHHPMDVGRWNGGVVVTGSSYFHGTIDDLVIYDRVLTESEIQDLYNM